MTQEQFKYTFDLFNEIINKRTIRAKINILLWEWIESGQEESETKKPRD